MNSVRKLPITVKRHAIVHMIGQMEQMLQPVKTSDVAAWLGCTKQTAKSYLDMCARANMVQCREENWRGTANVYYWKLTTGARILARKGAYKVAYQTILDARGISL